MLRGISDRVDALRVPRLGQTLLPSELSTWLWTNSAGSPNRATWDAMVTPTGMAEPAMNGIIGGSTCSTASGASEPASDLELRNSGMTDRRALVMRPRAEA